VILNIEFVLSLLHTLSLTHGVGDTRDLKVAELMDLIGLGRLVLAFLGFNSSLVASSSFWQWLICSSIASVAQQFLLCFILIQLNWVFC
jgi:hypothetical protein